MADEDADKKRGREARAWARNAVGEMTVAINELASMLTQPDDRVALGYVGNARSALRKVDEYLMRARLLLEPEEK